MAAPRQWDIEPSTEQCLELLDIILRRTLLLARQQPRERALAAPGQADQPVGPARDVGQPHMRILLDGTAEVRRRDERAQIVLALLVPRSAKPRLGTERVDPFRS